MPELEDLDFAEDPLRTHGAADGQRMELPTDETSIGQMLQLAAAKKHHMGTSIFAKPHEGNSVPKLPLNPPATSPTVGHEHSKGDPPKKRKVVIGPSDVKQKKKKSVV